LALVSPFAFGKGLRKFVGYDAIQHQVIQALGQLLAHDDAEVMRYLRRRRPRRASSERPDNVVCEVQHRGVLHKDLADAVPVDMIIFHILCWERLHPVDERCLLDDVNCCVEVEAPRSCWLKMTEIEIWVSQTIPVPASMQASTN